MLLRKAVAKSTQRPKGEGEPCRYGGGGGESISSSKYSQCEGSEAGV